MAIAHALLTDPDILLLDESASSLDGEAADRVESLQADVMGTIQPLLCSSSTTPAGRDVWDGGMHDWKMDGSYSRGGFRR